MSDRPGDPVLLCLPGGSGEMMPRPIDLTGRRFGRLVALRDVGRNKHGRLWDCACDCGNTKIIEARGLLKKIKPTRSCGCLHSETAAVNAVIARTLRRRSCRQCGTSCREIYCSRKCGVLYRRSVRLAKPGPPCRECGEPVPARPKGGRQVYCSEPCKWAADNRIAGERRALREMTEAKTGLAKRIEEIYE